MLVRLQFDKYQAQTQGQASGQDQVGGGSQEEGF
jgi:hypothetical protein